MNRLKKYFLLSFIFCNLPLVALEDNNKVDVLQNSTEFLEENDIQNGVEISTAVLQEFNKNENNSDDLENMSKNEINIEETVGGTGIVQDKKETLWNKISLNLGYPYIGIQYQFDTKWKTELRYANSSGINIYAGRLYYNLKNYQKINLFCGIEIGGIYFNTYDIKGDGVEWGPFIGYEYLISNKFSIISDFYPVLISLDSDSFNQNGFEFVINLGINFYFN
ncbi:MAG: hypothetical protein ACP5SD_01250 [Elusimicrobiales bacterium]